MKGGATTTCFLPRLFPTLADGRSRRSSALYPSALSFRHTSYPRTEAPSTDATLASLQDPQASRLKLPSKASQPMIQLSSRASWCIIGESCCRLCKCNQRHSLALDYLELLTCSASDKLQVEQGWSGSSFEDMTDLPSRVTSTN